jgi:hypothetical protein
MLTGRLFFFGIKAAGGAKLTSHVHLVSRLRVLGASSPVPNMSSWHRDNFTSRLLTCLGTCPKVDSCLTFDFYCGGGGYCTTITFISPILDTVFAVQAFSSCL